MASRAQPYMKLPKSLTPTRIKTAWTGTPHPNPTGGPDPETVISINLDGSFTQATPAFNAAAKPLVLLRQIQEFTGAKVIVHDIRYNDPENTGQKLEVMDAFDKGGALLLKLNQHWTQGIVPGETTASFEQRWKERHPDTQRIVYVDNATFPRRRHINPDFARVSSKHGFQMRHAKRIVEALGGDWNTFKTYRRQELAAIRKKAAGLKV